MHTPMTESGMIHFLLLLGSSSPLLPADCVCAGAVDRDALVMTDPSAAVVVTMTVETPSVAAEDAPDVDDAAAEVPRLVAAPVEAAADESAVEGDVPELGAVPELDAVGVVAVGDPVFDSEVGSVVCVMMLVTDVSVSGTSTAVVPVPVGIAVSTGVDALPPPPAPPPLAVGLASVPLPLPCRLSRCG